MTTTEHLAKVRAKCVELLEDYKDTTDERILSGWRSTIAAIEFLNLYLLMGDSNNPLIKDILAAWPEDTLL